jgi:hypothetical protein
MFVTIDKKDSIYQKYTDYDLFKFYIPEVSFKHNIKSPLRADDDTPSFHLYWTRNNTVCFVDHGLTTGNFWEYLKLKYGWTYHQAIDEVYNNLNGIKSYSKSIDYSKVNEKTRIRFTVRSANEDDVDFWNQYFTIETVKKLKIIPIKHYFTNNFNKPLGDYTYAMLVGSRIKIYQPYSKPKYFGNTNSSSIQGWHLLDPNIRECKLVSSMKEIGVLYEQGIQAIAPNSESTIIPPKIMNFLKFYWDLEILYDWDKAGRFHAQKHSNLYNLPVNKLQYEYFDVKDISDFRKKYGFYNTKELIRKI